MPWTMPTLNEVRSNVRDDVVAKLPGSDAMIPNSVLRVLADVDAGVAFLNLLHQQWLSEQFLPDLAETEWIDRHANLWIGGRKPAAFAEGTAVIIGIDGTIVPIATRLSAAGVEYETTEQVTLGAVATEVAIRALDAGAGGNQVSGAELSFPVAVAGATSASVIALTGGIGVENDESLRERVLTRMRKPPHGGADFDYVAWSREVPGVARAWAASESGMGTVTVRFMMDEADRPPYGIPSPTDVLAVKNYLAPLRPVTVRDLYVLAPKPYSLVVKVRQLRKKSVSVAAAIEQSIERMIRNRAKPGQTIYRSWVSEAVSAAAGEERHELDFETTVMPSKTHIAVLGTLTFSA